MFCKAETVTTHKLHAGKFDVHSVNKISSCTQRARNQESSKMVLTTQLRQNHQTFEAPVE